MTRTRAALLAVATVVAASVAGTSGAVSAQSVPPAVRSVTHVSTTSNGHALVTLTRPLHLGAGHTDPALRTSGSGAFHALLMRPRGQVSLRNDVPMLFVASLPRFAPRPKPYLVLGMAGNEPATFRGIIPAGVYDLYVAADGPVAVDLSLPGEPSGVVRIAAARTSHVQLNAGSGDLAPGVARPAYGISTSFGAPHGAVAAVISWRLAPVQAASADTTCMYPTDHAVQIDSTAPDCAGGYQAATTEIPGVRAPGDVLGFGWAIMSPGAWTLKTNYAVAAAVTGSGIMQVVVTP